MTRLSTRLAERPGGRRLFDILRKGDVLVVRWIDRLGRNYEDVVDNIREFVRRGIVIRTVISNFTIDGTTRDPMQKAIRDALIGFMAAVGEAQAEATKLAMKAGIAKAKAETLSVIAANFGITWGRKPSFDRQQLETVRVLLGQSIGISETAKKARVSRQTVYRIQGDPVGAEAARLRWERAAN